MNEVTLRPARKEEWSLLQELNNEVFVDNAQYDDDIVEDWAFSDEGREYFQTLVQDTESLCLVAEDEEKKLVGYIAVAPKEISYRKSRFCEIDNMGVIPAYRSQGVGKLLVEGCREWARTRGYQKIFVNAYAKNEKALQFYQRCGFEVIDISLETTL